MSSFIQHQTKELADYSNGREWGMGGGGAAGGDFVREAAKNYDRLTDQLFTD